MHISWPIWISISLCVSHHQNTTLLVTAVKLDVDVDDLVDMIVCDRTLKEYIMHRCSNCPGTDILLAFLLKKFDIDEDMFDSLHGAASFAERF